MAGNTNDEVDLYETEEGDDTQQTKYITWPEEEENNNQRPILQPVNGVGTSWKCVDSADGNTWNLMESWGIFGLSDVAWSSNCEIMLESSRRLSWKFLEMSD